MISYLKKSVLYLVFIVLIGKGSYICLCSATVDFSVSFFFVCKKNETERSTVVDLKIYIIIIFTFLVSIPIT